MDTTRPTRAYDLLDSDERDSVDDYLTYVLADAKRNNERIALSLERPIPTDIVKRSRGILLRPVVRAAMAEVIQERANQQDLNPTRVINEYAAIAFSSMADYIQHGDFGSMSIDITKCTPAQLAAIKTIKESPGLHGTKLEVVLHDKLIALGKLAELMGLVNSDAPPILAIPAKVKHIEQIGANAEKVYSDLLEVIK